MSTQIYINPNQCKPEFTKIAAHSFFTSPSVTVGTPDNILCYGGNYGPIKQATWSFPFYNYTNSALAPQVNISDKTAGIPIPINLVSDDIITFSGTAFFNNTGFYTEEGFDVTLKVGVFYFDCTYNQGPETPAFTFIPVESFLFSGKGQVCFETNVTLGSNFDIHETRLLVGFVVDVSCPDGTCVLPTPETEDLVTVSYTLDIQRPCAVITSESNFIIRNCCEPIITELVNIPGLTIGSFHVDDEGNCWEVMSASNDVTNFTRNFVDIYTSCVECQTVNPCPQNLSIDSCCVMGTELVTGSLPGLNVGDTFVDNNGLCWYVNAETGAPISEESITVVTEIIGDCAVCTAANPCPDFWSVLSCCGQLREIIATTVSLNSGDSFVDTNGICWKVDKSVTSLPTNYNIVVDTVYPGPMEACGDCTTANPCPLEYFITVRSCCDPDRVEVVSVPALYMTFSEGSIFSDEYRVCWEVMSYSTTGVETYPIDFSHLISIYLDCKTCTGGGGRKVACVSLYQVRDCNTDIIYTARVVNALLTVGSYYAGTVIPEFGLSFQSCFEVLGYGYPTVDPLEVFIGASDIVPAEYATCEECNGPVFTGYLLLTICCTGQTIVAEASGPIIDEGIVGSFTLYNSVQPELDGMFCCTTGPYIIPPTPTVWSTNTIGVGNYGSCINCQNDGYPCV